MSDIFQPFSSHDHHRYLFDEAFLDSGCNPTIFEEGGVEMTRVDNTIGTWATNYAILGLSLVGTFKFSCMMEPIHKRWLWSSLYFLFTGLGFGLAGVNHQIRDLKTDPNFYFVAFILTTLGALSLQYQISANLMASLSTGKLWIGYLYTMIVSLIGVAVICVLAIFGDQSIVAGGYLFASNIWFILYFSIIKDWAAAFGSFLVVVGMGVQFGLASTCGKDAYDDCWQDCFLPSPEVFNHNGLYHAILILAMFVHLFARFIPKEDSLGTYNEEELEEDKKAEEKEEIQQHSATA